MRVTTTITIDFDGSTVSMADAEQRADVLFKRALADGMDILTDGGAVVDYTLVEVEVTP